MTNNQVIEVTMKKAVGDDIAGVAFGMDNLEIGIPNSPTSERKGQIITSFPLNGPGVVKFNNNMDGLGRRWQQWNSSTSSFEDLLTMDSRPSKTKFVWYSLLSSQ